MGTNREEHASLAGRAIPGGLLKKGQVDEQPGVT